MSPPKRRVNADEATAMRLIDFAATRGLPLTQIGVGAILLTFAERAGAVVQADKADDSVLDRYGGEIYRRYIAGDADPE